MTGMSKCAPGCQCGRHSLVRERGIEKVCAECGTPFKAHRIDARFCSVPCRKVAYLRDNREKVRASSRRWTAANRERARELQRRYDKKTGYAKKRQQYADDCADPGRLEQRRERNREYYQRNAERLREYARQQRRKNPYAGRKAAHGTDWETLFAALWQAQDGRCYLCGDDLTLNGDRDIHLDHDHSCCGPERTCEKCRRGLACRRCNFVIAWASDDPARLRRIADSLEAVQLSH